MTCSCKNPKRVTVTVDVSRRVSKDFEPCCAYTMCDRCGLIVLDAQSELLP